MAGQNDRRVRVGKGLFTFVLTHRGTLFTFQVVGNKLAEAQKHFGRQVAECEQIGPLRRRFAEELSKYDAVAVDGRRSVWRLFAKSGKGYLVATVVKTAIE